MYEILNQGGVLISTNYHDSPAAKRGEFFLSWNAGVARLLVPKSQEFLLKEMRPATHVNITYFNDFIELAFVDEQPIPFVVNLAREQSDAVNAEGEYWFSIYVKFGMKFDPIRCTVMHKTGNFEAASMFAKFSYLEFLDNPTPENVQVVHKASGLKQPEAAEIARLALQTYKGWMAVETSAGYRKPAIGNWNYFMYELEARRLGYSNLGELVAQAKS